MWFHLRLNVAQVLQHPILCCLNLWLYKNHLGIVQVFFNLTQIRILSDLGLFLSTSHSSWSWTLPQESSSYLPYVLHLPLLGYGVQDWGGSHRHGWSLLQFLVSEPFICSGEWGCCSNGVSFILELGPQWLDRAQFLLSKFISEALQFSDSRCKEQVSLLVITHCFMGGHFFSLFDIGEMRASEELIEPLNLVKTMHS